jgi:putative hydrolase
VAAWGNREISTRLREAAQLLDAQGASPFRVRAYRRAADTVAGLAEEIHALLDRSGIAGLVALPGIGRSIALAINEMCRTGHWAQLDRLRGSADPEQLFETLPGVGPALAHRLHESLGVETLEALEAAAHDGRLEQLPGIGPRRAQMLRASLADLLRRGRARAARPPVAQPTVAWVLDVDREYREKAKRGELHKIAPRRFNPNGEAWLPVLHTRRGPWEFTALFSNTARAHQLERTHDWVVLYYHSDHDAEEQCTVVTERQGPAAGKRVVRGREDECLAHYRRLRGKDCASRRHRRAPQ